MNTNPSTTPTTTAVAQQHIPPVAADARTLYVVMIQAQQRLADIAHHATGPDEDISEAERLGARQALPVARCLCWRVRAAEEKEAAINQRLVRAHRSYQQRFEEEGDNRYYRLMSLADTYGDVTDELLRLVASWESMKNELDATPDIDEAVLEEGAAYPATHYCLERRVQTARHALEAMEHLLCVERERYALLAADASDEEEGEGRL